MQCGLVTRCFGRPCTRRYTFNMIRTLFLLALLSLNSFAEDAPSEEEIEKLRGEMETYLSQLDGEWIGEISGFELDGNYPNKPYKSKLIIRVEGHDVIVGKIEDGKKYKMPYEFKIERYKTHAVIYAFASDGWWVEGFNFLVTLQGINEMKLLWSRAVNNYMLPLENQEARGYFQGAALLKRQ